jgi:hypothetical protein
MNIYRITASARWLYGEYELVCWVRDPSGLLPAFCRVVAAGTHEACEAALRLLRD